MTTKSPMSHAGVPTYEGIVDRILDLVYGPLGPESGRVATPWDDFLTLSKRIHNHYEIPSTTMTPIMRRLLFGIGWASAAQSVVGVGTFVGYAFSWLIGLRQPSGSLRWSVGFDVDGRANVLARRNTRVLNHGKRLQFVTTDGVGGLATIAAPLDLVYLDLDDPRQGKSAYQEVLCVAARKLRTGGLILAHDPCVPKFRRDFQAYHRCAAELGLFADPIVFPVDTCGLSLLRKLEPFTNMGRGSS